MFGGYFDMDKPFWRWVGKIPELIALSFFWFLGCIPIITIIPSSCALFDAISRNTMMDDKGSFRRFFRTFVRELKQGIPLTLLWLLIAGLSIYGAMLMFASQSLGILAIIYGVMIVMLIPYLGWLVPLQSRYNHTFIGLHVNAIKFFIGRLPGSGLILLTTVAGVGVCFIHPYTACLLIVVPSVIAVFHTLVVEKAFMVAFPNDYEDGLPVYTEQDRIAIQAIKKAKQEETQNRAETE